MSPEEIFDLVSQHLPVSGQLASGGLVDARGLSDVDVAAYHPDPASLESEFPEGTVSDHRDDRSMYQLSGYDRPVNVYVSSDKNRAFRSLKHREIELELEKRFPDLAIQARENKASGMNTEPAWSDVLRLRGDPYEAMLDRDQVLSAAKRRGQNAMVASADHEPLPSAAEILTLSGLAASMLPMHVIPKTSKPFHAWVDRGSVGGPATQETLYRLARASGRPGDRLRVYMDPSYSGYEVAGFTGKNTHIGIGPKSNAAAIAHELGHTQQYRSPIRRALVALTHNPYVKYAPIAAALAADPNSIEGKYLVPGAGLTVAAERMGSEAGAWIRARSILNKAGVPRVGLSKEVSRAMSSHLPMALLAGAAPLAILALKKRLKGHSDEPLKEASSNLYHGSPHLADTLEPKNEHGDPDIQASIFATPERTFALPYVGRKWSDRDFNQSTWGKGDISEMIIREMRPGALEETYKGVPGYLYHLADKDFERLGRSGSIWEVVSKKPVKPLKVERIADALKEMQADPRIRLEKYDPKHPETREAIRRMVTRMKDMDDPNTPNYSSFGSDQYRKWRLEGAPPEIVALFNEEEGALKEAAYKLEDKYKFQGFPISIENTKGSTRTGTDSDGHDWSSTMNCDYGYIRGTIGGDKEHLDVFIGPHEDSTSVFIIRQIDPKTKKYDEDKVLLGFKSQKQAMQTYLGNYDRHDHVDGIREVPLDAFRAMVKTHGGKKLTDPAYMKKAALLFIPGYRVVLAADAASAAPARPPKLSGGLKGTGSTAIPQPPTPNIKPGSINVPGMRQSANQPSSSILPKMQF